MVKLGKIMLTVAIVGLLPLTGQAVYITVNDGATVVLDNESFETTPVGNLPAGWGTEGGGGAWPVVTDAASPGAYHGSRYLAYDGGEAQYAGVSLGGSQVPGDGDIDLGFMAYIESTAAYMNTALTQSVASGPVLWFRFENGGNNVQYLGDTGSGWGWVSTGLTYPVGQWFEVAVHVDMPDAGNPINTMTGTVSINGGPAFALGNCVDWQGTSYAAYVTISNSTGASNVYVDAIPEPATIGLLALGALGLIRREK